MAVMPSGGDGIEKRFGMDHKTNLIGTPATEAAITHQDGKIKEYIKDNSHNIMFIDLLEQLRDYQNEDRTKYDLVIAMGLCELADEDMLGVPAQERGSETKEFSPFGYYKDPKTGHMKFGKLPGYANKTIESESTTKQQPADWIDASGQLRFDNNTNITDADLLESDVVG